MTLDPLVLFGAIGSILTAVLSTGIKGVWVWGRELAAAKAECETMSEDRDFWRDYALKALGVTDKAISKVSARDA